MPGISEVERLVKPECSQFKVANPTPIQEFYSHQSIFITGGTGFLGQLLIEKLLRTCSDLAFLYLLVRPKKGKDIQQRIDELFDNSIFEKMKEQNPKFRHQIIPIAGDCTLPDLGISTIDMAILIQEVSIVFHVAATVRFDENLKDATMINVRSSKIILKLCKEMIRLKSYIHVSTAYANCVEKIIEEKFYTTPIDGNKLIALVENMDYKVVDTITKPILGKWPNTYTFTKAVTEDIVRQEANNIPVGIFRPAIVLSTYQEPINGWNCNLNGQTGAVVACSMGLLRSLYCNESCRGCIVPGDLTINALIAVGWDIANRKRDHKNSNDIPIYNYVSDDNPINYGQIKELLEKFSLNFPPSQAIWYYSLNYASSEFVHLIYMYCLHLLPAILIDTVSFCVGKKPTMYKIYQKIRKSTDVLNYFMNNEWTFTSNNVQKLYEKLNSRDRKLFFMNISDFTWETFYQNYMKGIRLYILKDPFETLPQARIRYRRLYWLHQTLKVIFSCMFLSLCWFLLSILL